MTPPGEIAHPALLERIARRVPLGVELLNPRHYSFLQTRIKRDETPDAFSDRVRAGIDDFWNRFQRPFSTRSDTVHLNEELVRGSMEELMGFNGWMTSSCESLKRPSTRDAGANFDDDWSDLTRRGSLYYIALVVHDGEHFLVDQLAVIVQLSKRLGPSSIFVSLVDYGSDDSTPFLSDMIEAVLVLLGIPFRIRQAPPMTSDPSASYYPLEEAYGRNLALEPLLELAARRKILFRRVIWLKGFNCPRDILDTLRVSLTNDAVMVCGLDWKEQQTAFFFNDRWRTRDMDGNLFRGSSSSPKIGEVPPQHVLDSQRYLQHLPFQAFCCESGTHVVDPHKSYYEGVVYTSSTSTLLNLTTSNDTKSVRWGEGPCMDSSQVHFCRDLWMVAFRKGVKLESERLARQEQKDHVGVLPQFMGQLVASMRRSFDLATSDIPRAANSGDYLADETGVGTVSPKLKKVESQVEIEAKGNDKEMKKQKMVLDVIEDLEEGIEDEDAKGITLDPADVLELELIEPSELDETAGSLLLDIGAAPAIPKYQSPNQPIRNKPKRPADGRVPGPLPNPLDVDHIPPPPVIKAKLPKPHARKKKSPPTKEVVLIDNDIPQKVESGPKPIVRTEPRTTQDPSEAISPEEEWAKFGLEESVVENPLGKRDLNDEAHGSEHEVVPKVVENDRGRASDKSSKVEPLEQRRPRSLPNSAFDYAIARILINPRCVTTYAGVSHVQLAEDLFGTGEGKAYDPDDDIVRKWRTPPESFVCQEMRNTGGKLGSLASEGGRKLITSSPSWHQVEQPRNSNEEQDFSKRGSCLTDGGLEVERIRT